MGLGQNEIQVQFSSSDTGTLSAGGTLTSDLVTLTVGALRRLLRVKADSAATQTDGDDIEVHWLQKGDIDNDSTDDQDNQGTLVLSLDPYADDPANKAGFLEVEELTGYLKFVSGASQNCTVSAKIIERTWS